MQHGDLRESREAGSASGAGEGDWKIILIVEVLYGSLVVLLIFMRIKSFEVKKLLSRQLMIELVRI